MSSDNDAGHRSELSAVGQPKLQSAKPENAELQGLWSRIPKSPDAAVLTVLLIAVFLGTYAATQTSILAGSFQDDGIYLVTSKALADGKGYRHIEFPGEPYQTKYPILYPVVLSLIWRVFPSFPANIVAMQVLNGLFAAGAAAIGYHLVRRAWGLSPLLAGAGMLLAISSLDWLQMIRMTMSEHLYTFLSLAAVTLAINPLPGSPDAVSRRRLLPRSVLSALLASAAYLTRSIGITLIAALFIHWLLRRRWLPAACVLLLGGMAIAGWQSWRLGASEHNATIAQAACFAYDLDYTVWLPHSWGFALRVMLYNAASMCFWLLYYLGQPSLPWVQAILRAGLPHVAVLYALIGLAVCLVVIGLVSARRSKQTVIPIYLLFYLGVVCAWPFDPDRFFIPVMPILTPLALLGFRRACASLRRLIQRLIMPLPSADSMNQMQSDARAMPAHLRLGRAGAILTALLLLNSLVVTMSRWSSFYEKAAEKDRATVVEMLKTHTPPTGIVAVGDSAYCHLATARKAVPFNPGHDEYPALRYAEDRPVLLFGLGTSAGQLMASARLIEKRYLDYGRITGLTHVLVAGDEGVEAEFLEYCSKEPAHFQLVARSGAYRLYRFRL